MFKRLALIPLLAVVTACGGTTGTIASHASTSPQIQRDENQLTIQAEKCFKGPRSLSQKGREAFMNCFATPKRKAAGRICIDKQMQEQGLPFTKRKRQIFMQEVAHCMVVSK